MPTVAAYIGVALIAPALTGDPFGIPELAAPLSSDPTKHCCYLEEFSPLCSMSSNILSSKRILALSR